MNNIKNKTLFIGIGAQKTGTTWLAEYLSNNPDVYFSPIKEIHYFNTKHLKHNIDNIFVKKIKNEAKKMNNQNYKYHIEYMQLYIERLNMDSNIKYLEYFNKKMNNKKIFGEITPAYSMLDSKGFEDIKNIHPDVKIIFGMRNPVERYWSQLRFTTKFNKDFDPELNFKSYIDRPEYLLRGNYKRTIQELEKVFDRKDIFYYFYEDLFGKKGEEVLKNLSEFLDIKYIDPNFKLSQNVSKKVNLNMSHKAFAYEYYHEIITFVKEYFNGDIPSSWEFYNN